MLTVEKNWSHSVDQCQLQGLQFSVYLIDLLSILGSCNGFAGIQKAIVDQMDCRPPNSDHDLFLVQFCLWEVLWSFSAQPLSWSLLIVQNPLVIACYNQRNGLLYNKRRQHLKMIFLICSQLMRHPLTKSFYLSNLLQTRNNCRMVDVEYLGNLSCSCKRISFNDTSQLVFVNL